MTDTIQVQYEAIEQLAAQIHQQAEQTGTVLQKVRSQTESLADSWVGEGATAFQHEMEEDVLPGLKRLTASLEVGGAVIKRIAEIFREAEEEAANQFPDGEGEPAGSAVGAGAGHGGPSGGSPRPSLSGGGGGGSRSPVGRVSEPLRMDQGMIAQSSLVDMRRTNPAEANRIYEQIVAMDTQGGFQVGVKIGDLELKVDIGSGVHATIEGMDGEFSSGTLDNLWNTLVDDRHVTVTVPSLSSEAEDQLERLVGLAREKIDPDVFIVVRETLPS
ncbi:MAG: WXG100 family type VII secretion target [Anaerolineales bacterium]|nr:WXG100 family type VII secretion target [Anaerolineales bacterium]